MKKLCLTIFTALALAACHDAPPVDPGIATTARQQRSIDMWYVDVQNQTDVTNGVLTQHTLFAYDFDPFSSRLSELGHRDLAILAGYYKSTPGPLTLVKGDASNDLYAARTATVRDALAQSGVDLAGVTIGDGFPGGRGVSGQAIVNAVKNDKGQFSGASSDTGSITNEGLTTGTSDSSMKGINK